MRIRLTEYKLQRVIVFLFCAAAAMMTTDLANFAGAAEPRTPESSRIIELFDNRSDKASVAVSRRLDLASYRRPDIIGPLYEGKFELIPATGLDNMRYFGQLVGDLAARCPSLGLDADKHQLIPYILSAGADLFQRFKTDQLSQSEVLQSVWMAVVALNKRWSCQYHPGRDMLDQAQARCNEAAKDHAELSVLPSFDAAQDTTLFLGRHGCGGAEARHLARQLIAFGRIAHTRTHLTERMPSPTSPAGRAYAAIFENCARGSLDDRAYAWCGCYVRTLHSLNPPERILRALEQNPFVDGSTYITWIARTLPGGNALYQCERTLVGKPDWRDAYAPRTTACLIDDKSTADGARECRYRAACSVFTITGDRCAPEISSRRWGYREVDCKAGGGVAAPRFAPREWRRGAFTLIDYETEVAPDFVPPLPADARTKHPLEVRLLKRETPGLLQSMSLTLMTDADLMIMGTPPNLLRQSGPEIAAIDRESALLLKCTYKSQRGLQRKTYWFERVPKHVQNGQVNPVLQPYFARIAGARSSCPASD
jgi:hypothetical protein